MAETPDLDTLIRKGLEDQAQVDNYGEGTVTITGPIDLDELANYVIGWLPPVTDPIETSAEASAAHAANNLTIAHCYVSEAHEFTKQQCFIEFSDHSVLMMRPAQFRAIDEDAKQRHTATLAKQLKLDEGDYHMLSMWPDFDDGRKMRVLITGPDQPKDGESTPQERRAYIRRACLDLVKAIDEEDSDGVRTT